MEYTKEMFEKDKKEFIDWLTTYWQYEKHETELGNILIQLMRLFKGK